MRTQIGIVEMIEKRRPIPMDFFPEVLIDYLTFQNAKHYLKDGTPESEFTRLTDPLSAMTSYMEFAWEKASDHRSLSAARSVNKMQAWLWLMYDELWWDIEKDKIPYTNYGAPILLAICKKYSIPIPEDDSGVLRMALGIKCRNDCDAGCI